jgi:uncharacterized protein (TIGR03084 family)
VAHLTFYDRLAGLAVSDPAAFAAHREIVLADVARYEQVHLDLVPRHIWAMLSSWRDAALLFRMGVLFCEPGVRVPWFGPSMSLRSMITARLMETWAHGHDVADALNVVIAPTGRLKHVATIAFRAHDYGYLVRGLTPPPDPIAVVLTAPDGQRWTLGPLDADSRVEGSAEDFCLVLARRRHVDDTALRCVGKPARSWMELGQMYAGPPGNGPQRARGDTHAVNGRWRETARVRVDFDT